MTERTFKLTSANLQKKLVFYRIARNQHLGDFLSISFHVNIASVFKTLYLENQQKYEEKKKNK